MSLEEAIRSFVADAVKQAAPLLRAELERPKMLPIKETPVAYRALLDAERRGELTIYRVGHASLVDEVELYEWIRRTGVGRAPEAEPVDETAKLIELGDARRRRRA